VEKPRKDNEGENHSRASDKGIDNINPKSKISIKNIFKHLGPGIITGAADDDPSGIATYSQAGAKFGFGMLWMVIYLYPMMAVIQEICGRIGLMTGDGLAAVIKRKYSNKVVLPLASLLVVANTINIGADIGAMGASVRLVIPQLPFFVPTLLFTGTYPSSRNICSIQKIRKGAKILDTFSFCVYYYGRYSRG
jgi:Mn2+/Fe2+ NRAMP family transporter